MYYVLLKQMHTLAGSRSLLQGGDSQNRQKSKAPCSRLTFIFVKASVLTGLILWGSCPVDLDRSICF